MITKAMAFGLKVLYTQFEISNEVLDTVYKVAFETTTCVAIAHVSATTFTLTGGGGRLGWSGPAVDWVSRVHLALPHGIKPVVAHPLAFPLSYQEFSLFTRDAISRIEGNSNVFGILYFRKDYPELCTLPEDTAKTLITKLPSMTSAIRRAVVDIDVTNEPIAYRIETKRSEIAVVMDKQFTACVVHKSKSNTKTKQVAT